MEGLLSSYSDLELAIIQDFVSRSIAVLQAETVKLSTDPLSKERAIRRAGTLSLLLCALCFGVGYVVLPLVFKFPTVLVNRLAFALQASLSLRSEPLGQSGWPG